MPLSTPQERANSGLDVGSGSKGKTTRLCHHWPHSDVPAEGWTSEGKRIELIGDGKWLCHHRPCRIEPVEGWTSAVMVTEIVEKE